MSHGWSKDNVTESQLDGTCLVENVENIKAVSNLCW